jgi:hypothetical protein
VAHGIAGPLALISTAVRRGVIVNGHGEAIATICGWFDQWQAGQGRHSWWPEVITLEELQAGTTAHAGPHRPSWCYGTPGVCRAQQLAAIALGDLPRARKAEQAMLGCLGDQRQLAHLGDAGLCHGWAGLVHTAGRVAADAHTSQLATAITTAAEQVDQHLPARSAPASGGLLEGAAGVKLAAAGTHESRAGPAWDDCLLVN